MSWRIEQESTSAAMGGESWLVSRGAERHWAKSAEDAVKLMRALQATE